MLHGLYCNLILIGLKQIIYSTYRDQFKAPTLQSLWPLALQHKSCFLLSFPRRATGWPQLALEEPQSMLVCPLFTHEISVCSTCLQVVQAWPCRKGNAELVQQQKAGKVGVQPQKQLDIAVSTVQLVDWENGIFWGEEHSIAARPNSEEEEDASPSNRGNVT